MEMNIAHPFREGNGRNMRIWLDLMLKKRSRQSRGLERCGQDDYLLAMERSPSKDTEIKVLLNAALTEAEDDLSVCMKGIGASYHHEGYNLCRTEDLGS